MDSVTSARGARLNCPAWLKNSVSVLGLSATLGVQTAVASTMTIETIFMKDVFMFGMSLNAPSTSMPSINDNGDVVFTLSDSTGDWLMESDGDTRQLVVRDSLGSTNASSVVEINNSGDVAYYDTSGGTGQVSINGQVVVQNGDSIPGMFDTSGNALTFTNVRSMYNAEFADNGELVVKATTSDGKDGIWRITDTGPSLVSLVGDSAPGSANSFSAIQSSAMNNQGDLVFTARLNDGSSTLGVWRETRDGNLERVNIDTLVGTDPITGQPLLITPDSIDGISHLSVDGDGNPIFNAQFTANGQQLSGLWRMDGTSAEFVPDAFGGNIVANASGQIAGLSWGWDPVTADTISELWIDDPIKGLDMVVATGDVLEVAPGDFRTVQGATFSPQGLSDAGNIVFTASFYNQFTGIYSQGIFAASFDDPAVGNVPVPSSAMLMLLGCACLVGANRRILKY